MSTEKKEKEIIEEEKVLISFLKTTKEGKYAKVEETSLPYSRIKEETIIIEDEYYYGTRWFKPGNQVIILITYVWKA